MSKRIRWIVPGVMLLTLLGSTCAGQPASAPGGAPAKPAESTSGTDALSVERVEQLVKQLDEKQLDPQVKEAAAELYAQAMTQLRTAQQWKQEAAKWQQLKSEAPDLTAQLKEQLDKPPLTAPFAPPPDATLVQMEQQLATARDTLEQLHQKLQDLEREPARRAGRRKTIPSQLLEARQRLEAVERELAAGVPAGEPPDVVRARQTLLTAERLALRNAIAALNEELSAYDSTIELLELQRKTAAREVAHAEQDRALVEQAVAELRREESARQAAAAKQAAARVPEPVRPLADENLRLSSLRTGPAGQPQSGLAARITAANEDLEATDKTLQQLDSMDEEITEREKLGSLDDFYGPWLLRQYDKLPRSGDLRRQIYQHQLSVSETQRMLSGLRLRQTELDDLDAALKQWLAERQLALSADQQDGTRDQARDLLEQQQQLVDAVITDASTLLSRLNALVAKKQVLITRVQDLAQQLGEELMWVRAHTVLGPRDVTHSVQAAMWFLDPENWARVLADLPRALREHALFVVVFGAVVVALLVSRSRMKRQLWQLGAAASQGYLVPFRITLRAFGLTLLMTLLWPLAIAVIGWPLYDYYGGDEFSQAIGAGLLFAAAVYVVVEFMRRTGAVHGLAEDHFRWDARWLKLLRRHLRWLSLSMLPLVFLTATLVWEGTAERRDSLGRLLLAVVLGLLSLFMWRVLRPLPPVTPDAAVRKLGWWERLGRWFLILSPLFTMVLLLLGYQYTARVLSVRLLFTLCLVAFMLVFHGMALRWLCSVRGKLALEQTRQRREAKRSQTERGTLGGEEVVTEVDQGIDLGTVNMQTRRLLQASLGITAFVGLWFLWLDVLPGENLLDHALWSSPTTVTRAVADTQGTTPQTITEYRPFTVSDLVLAIVLGIATLVAARNFPGLLEVSLPQEIPLDAGARYALSTIIRYVIFAVGVIIVSSQLGIGWSRVQWLVAALSVGVGFGLQELVANFISGLILLFERPVRVNDIVTIGDVTGMVTRVQIRATTVRNWDQQEYIIPNKELITGRVLNWTLTDTRNRVTIMVGVAYGTDTDQATRLLHEILRDHPEVLDDPAPLVTFEQFGDSSLNFVIRAQLPSLERRLLTLHELHSLIHARFGQAGIQIPFPQRDLHIRSSAVPTGLG